MRIAKNIANTLLAITLLVATTGITLNKHYCMGRLMSIAVFEHAKNSTGTDMQDPMPCCEDTSQELKVEEITTIAFNFDAQPLLFQVAAIDFSLLKNIAFAVEETKPHFQHYSPPLPDRDIPIFVQSFLI